MTVVLAAAGTPGAPRAGDVITGAEQPGVIHAGTRRRDDGAVVSSGGRVLSATAVGDTLAEARERAYDLVGASTCRAGSTAPTSPCARPATRSRYLSLPDRGDDED